MAVSFLRIKSSLRLYYPLYNVLQSFRLNSANRDSMETFISELTTRKINKFNKLRGEIRRNQSQADISVKQRDLFKEIYDCLDSRDEEALESVIDKWLEKPIQLPLATLCELVEFSSKTGNTKLFHKLIVYTTTFEPDFHKEKLSYFEALNLELDWRTGTNVDQLIENFESLYKKSFSDEVASRHMASCFNAMMKDCVEKKGEAVVLKLKDKIVKMCEESKDYLLLFELWRNLFESFWFSDQQIASELIATHATLREMLSKQLSLLCFTYLRNNNTELVNRLIQIFLQFNMMRQVETLVKLLFDFECWRQNMDAVVKIVQLCRELGIELTEKESKKLVELLLKRPIEEKKKETATKITIQEYQFKF